MPTPIELGSLNNLPPLDKIKYTQLDYDTIKQGIVQFIKANYPNIQNDFFESNAGIMIIDLLSWINDTLALRTDFLVNEAYLATASTQKAILQMLNYINYYPAGASPAIGTVTITLTDGDPGLFTGAALTNDVIISSASAPYEIFITDNSGNPLTYEVFKSAIDKESTVIFPAGSIIGSSITAAIVEGKTVLNNIKLPANVTQNFIITLPDMNIIENYVTININGIVWRQTTNFAFENGPTNTFEVRQINQSQYQVVFGDGVFGAIPPSNGLIEIKYRIGGGAVGNISLGTMNTVQTITSNQLPVTFKFYNSTASNGGADQENLEYAKKIAPKNFAAQLRTVTGEDYTVYALGYSNGTSGSIAKALSIIRPYLAAYGRNTGNYDITSSNNKIKVRIDDIYKTIVLTVGNNLTLQQICDDFNAKATALFMTPALPDFSAWPYPATVYSIKNTKTDATVAIDALTRNINIKYNSDIFPVILTLGTARTYQQICDDINAQTNTGNNADLYEFRAQVNSSGYIELVAVRPFSVGVDTFTLTAVGNSAYSQLGFTTLQIPLAYSGNKFGMGLNYHNPSAAFEVMSIANSAYTTLGLDYSSSNNGLGRALPMAANYVDIYVLANGANNIITTASAELKSALINFINRFKVLTDSINIWDGALKYIGFNILIVVNPSYNITTVRNNALAYLNVYTSGVLNNFGDSMYISKIYELLEAVTGVDHVEINNITENGISQLITGNGLIRDVGTNWNEVWVRDTITTVLTAQYKVAS